MNLTQLFDLSFAGRRNQEALEFEGATYTFGDMDERSNRLANLLAARGVQMGDRLCVYMANSIDMIDLYLACVKLGVIFVPINILYRDREISHILSDAAPVAVVTSADFASTVPVWRPADLTREAAGYPADRPAISVDGDAPAGIIYTSGTTGTSKGAVLTHNNLATNAVNLVTCWQITSADRFLLALPLFHVHGLGNGLHSWLMSGCRMRLLERFEHQKAAATFLDFRPTLFFGVPTVYVRLLDLPEDTAREIGSQMRLFVSGSAPLPAQVMEDFHAKFGHTILERYGMSETVMNISNPYIGERRPGSVGLPLPGVSVRLLDPEGRPVKDGETGEVYLKGSNIFAGYWRREDATRAAFVDGYFRTGDLAVRSPDGYYTLSGRKSDLIISGGFNIYPREIEEFLQEQDEVAEAAVVGIADRVRGEVPVAFVVLRTQVDPGVLESRCREKLASFKIPREFVAVETLPRNAMGKIQKHLLPEGVTPAFDAIVLGAGAAGLMCAIEAGKRGKRVAVLEHADRTGKKILISGGGRCNFTNVHCTAENFLSSNPHFAKSALARYTPGDFLALVEKHRIPYHEKTLGQLFCDRAALDIVTMLERECREAGVKVFTRTPVTVVERGDQFIVRSGENEFRAEALVVATGGLSIPKMGATGLGYELARQFGLKVRECRPALVPLTLGGEDRKKYCDLAGVSAEVIASCSGQSFREKMLITHRGLSGPAILQISSYWKKPAGISIDLAPDAEVSASDAKASLRRVLANRLADRWLEVEGAKDIERRVHAWDVRPSGTEGYEKAEVTAGGVDTDELSAKTMESRKAPGLYFIGEVVDVTGHLGGFNFQWAWASGAAAGRAI